SPGTAGSRAETTCRQTAAACAARTRRPSPATAYRRRLSHIAMAPSFPDWSYGHLAGASTRWEFAATVLWRGRGSPATGRGAGYRVRTGDIKLGKLALYQLS